MKKYIIASILAFVLVLQASPASAETTMTTASTDTAASMLTMMQTLMKQVEMLQKQLAMMQAGMKEMPVKPVKMDDMKKEEVRDKVRDKVRSELGGMGTTSVEKVLTAAEDKIEALGAAIESATDTTVAKKSGKLLTEAKKKLADAEEKATKGKYRDAFAKAMQAKRLAERGLVELVEVEDEDDSMDDEDEDEDEDDEDEDDSDDDR